MHEEIDHRHGSTRCAKVVVGAGSGEVRRGAQVEVDPQSWSLQRVAVVDGGCRAKESTGHAATADE